MPGKARIHELAKELGLTSKQVLSKAQDLGFYVQSPSSTIEAADARRLREAFTGRGQPSPRRHTWPHRPVGNNPYFPSRPARPDVMPAPRTQSPGPQPRQTPISPRSDADSFNDALWQAQARSKRKKPNRTSVSNPYGDIILARSPSLLESHGRVPAVVHQWAQMWIEKWFEADEVAAWMEAGLKGNEAHLAAQLRRERWTPVSWVKAGSPGKP